MVSFSDAATEDTGTDTSMTEPQRERQTNVSMAERIAIGAAGGLIALEAFRRPPLTRLLLGAAGGVLLHRAISGYCPLYQKLGINTARGGAVVPHGNV